MMGAEHRTRIIAATSGRLALLAVVVVVASALHPATVRAAPTPSAAFVRVNQVGYPLTVSKRAYLMASVVETGATFSVRNASGDPVFSAPIGANLGSWSSTYSNVYALDFNAVATPGSYTISVSGPVPATSPSSRSTRAPTCTPRRWPTPCRSIRPSGTARTSSRMTSVPPRRT